MQQYLPLAVLKLWYTLHAIFVCNGVATVLTVYGIETLAQHILCVVDVLLQQYLPLAVCDEGCEAAEEQSDDEARTSLVPARREGKTKVMK